MGTESAPITRAMLEAMPKEELEKLVRDPVKLAEINAYLLTDEGRGIIAEITSGSTEPGSAEETIENLAIEEFNKEESERVEEANKTAALVQAEAIRLAEEAAKAEVEALSAAGITIYRDGVGNIVKLVQEYQADDGNGNAIGRSTHLEARGWAELAKKQREAHVQATRAFHRLKDQKTTFKKPDAPIAIPEVPLLSEQERIQAALDLNSDDEQVVIKADRKLRADQILRDQRQEAINKEEQRQREVSNEFKLRHLHDFNPVHANSKIISEYLKEHNLLWTLDNLELAFAASEPQLVPVPGQVVEDPETPEDNPTAIPQVIEPIQAAAAIQPAPVAPVVVEQPVVPAQPNTPATPRRGVNAGLQPGQSTGQRPQALPTGLTMKEIMKWSGEQMRKERRNPARSAEIDRVIASYNKARASRV